MLRALIGFTLLTLPAFGQLQLFQFDGTNETLVGSNYQAPSVAVGDTLATRFHVRNTSTGPATLQTITVAGQGFTIASAPSLPYVIAAGQFAEFRVVFAPTGLGSYSANMQVNSVMVLLRASAVATATVSNGSKVLAAGAVVDFGSSLKSTTVSQTLTLTNPSSTNILISTITVTGAAFKGSGTITVPLNLGAGQSYSFQVAFTPTASGTTTGTLSIDQRSFGLTGIGLLPPLPKAAIALVSTTMGSAQQATIGVQLAAATQVSATGTLTMEFHSSLAGTGNDAAVQFLSGPPLAATVTFSPGDVMGHFNAATQLAFQTGTTAGTILFKLQLPNDSQQATVTIAPSPVTIDTATGTAEPGALIVSLWGFDNTHSASQIAFTFYGTTGQAMQSPIQVDLTNNFKTYFTSTTAGGAFALRANFPVSGDVTAVAGVDVALTNSAGVTKTQRLTF